MKQIVERFGKRFSDNGTYVLTIERQINAYLETHKGTKVISINTNEDLTEAIVLFEYKGEKK